MIHPDYTPQPIDTSDIQLSEELKQLIELIARNVHDSASTTLVSSNMTSCPRPIRTMTAIPPSQP